MGKLAGQSELEFAVLAHGAVAELWVRLAVVEELGFELIVKHDIVERATAVYRVLEALGGPREKSRTVSKELMRPASVGVS